jgi:hypothetical protein
VAEVPIAARPMKRVGRRSIQGSKARAAVAEGERIVQPRLNDSDQLQVMVSQSSKKPGRFRPSYR